MMLSSIIGFLFILSVVSVNSGYQHCQKQQHKQYLADSLPWLSIGNLEGQRAAHASVAVKNRIYTIGGIFINNTESRYYNDVQFFEIDIFNGTILPDSLSYTNPIAVARYQLAVAYYNQYIYIVGGSSSSALLLNDVEYGRVEDNGKILKWITSTSKLNFARAQHQVEILKTSSGNTYLAAISGVADIPGAITSSPTDTIEVAKIQDDGSLGQWFVCPFHIKGARQWASTSVVNGYLYVMGGLGTLSLNEMFTDIQFASILDNGCPSPWTTSFHQLIMPLFGHKSVPLNSNALVVFGGNSINNNYFNNVQYSTINTDDPDTTAWAFSQFQFSYPRYAHSAVQVNGTYAYVIGGQAGPQEYLDDIEMSVLVSSDTNIA